MKKCAKCGKQIIYGVNGCMLMDDCFECHGGYPKYAPATKRNSANWDELDYLENRCVNDLEE